MQIIGKSMECYVYDVTSGAAAAKKKRAQLEPVSSNGGRKISLFEQQNFNEESLFDFFFLDKRTSYMTVSYFV